MRFYYLFSSFTFHLCYPLPPTKAFLHGSRWTPMLPNLDTWALFTALLYLFDAAPPASSLKHPPPWHPSPGFSFSLSGRLLLVSCLGWAPRPPLTACKKVLLKTLYSGVLYSRPFPGEPSCWHFPHPYRPSPDLRVQLPMGSSTWMSFGTEDSKCPH